MPNNTVRQGPGGMVAGAGGIMIKDGVLKRTGDSVEQAVYYCKKCTYRDPLYNVVRKHIYREHFQQVAQPYIVKPGEKTHAQNGGTAGATGNTESNNTNTVNSNQIHCKKCLFVPRTYEALVQHVIEDHERIGYQVTAMIGHTSVIVPRPKPIIMIPPKTQGDKTIIGMGPKGAVMATTRSPGSQQLGRVVIASKTGFNSSLLSGMKHDAVRLKAGSTQPFSIGSQQVRVTLPGNAQVSVPQQSHAAKQLISGGSMRSPIGVSASSSLKSNPLGSRVQAAATTVASVTAKKGGSSVLGTSYTQKWKICTICNELFPENVYSSHFEKEHKAEKVPAVANYIMKIHNFTSKCLLCNRYLPSDTLLNHMLIHGLTCPQCHSAFHNVEKIMEHTSQAHPDDFVGPPGASPLTFDLTIKQEKSSNVQLVVLTFNMKESVNGQDQSAPAQNAAPPLVKVSAPRMIEKKPDPLAGRSYPAVTHKSEVGKTLCPLCFTILKGPISDALAMHLRERHQVLQTMHPVEKKMTYKCIHCLGVYTSNMVASTITLHLVQCRAVGRTQASQGFKSALTLNSSGAGFLKRQPPPLAMTNPKKLKLSKESKISTTAVVNQFGSDGLALDPRSYEHKTYEARKNFLTAYFNRRPYLTPQEEERLSASLWLWKSDIASHFANKRRVCEKLCETKKVSVLLGFDMHAVRKVKHDLIFEDSKLDGTSVARPGGLKFGTPNTDQNRQCETLNCTLKLSTCTETISIDSDSEPEIEETPTENGNVDTNQQENVLSQEPVNLIEETEPVNTDDSPREQESALQDGKANAGMTSC